MIAEILSIGTELLMGQIVNTNARYISEHFPEGDVYVYYHTVVGDNKERIKQCLLHALNRADIVITTGGLGPTQDDITKEVISEVLHKKLEVNEEVLEGIHRFFNGKSRKMSPNNLKQAYFPKDSILITNDMGTAPGCLVKENNKYVIMLPGPPHEMEPMFSQFVLPYFKKMGKEQLQSRFIRLFGIGESSMENEIKDIISSQSNPTIAPYAKQGEVTLRITAKYNEKTENADDILNPIIDRITRRLGKYIYSYNNEELREVVYKKLAEKNLTVSFAESCTGGLLAKYMTDISGSSKVMDSSIVTYSNQSKIALLGVNEETLNKYGAVSEQVAIEMVNGLSMATASSLCLSITGLAGPTGETKEKPIGLVYIAVKYKEKLVTKQLNLWGKRDRIRHVTCLNAFDLILKIITNEDIN